MSIFFPNAHFPGSAYWRRLRTDQQPCWWDWVVREWEVDFSYNVAVDYSYTGVFEERSYVDSFAFSVQDSGLVPYEEIYVFNGNWKKMPRHGDVIYDKADYIQTAGHPYLTASYKKPGDPTEYKSIISKIRMVTNEFDLPIYGRTKTECETPVTISRFSGKNTTIWEYTIPWTCESLYTANSRTIWGGKPKYHFMVWQSYGDPYPEDGINPSYSFPIGRAEYRSVEANFSFPRPSMGLFPLGRIDYNLILGTFHFFHFFYIKISVNGPTEPGQLEGGWESTGGNFWSLSASRNLGQIGQMTYKCGSMPDLVLPVTAEVSFEIYGERSDILPPFVQNVDIRLNGTAIPKKCFTYGGIYDENTGQRV